jgi:hypothetical protein
MDWLWITDSWFIRLQRRLFRCTEWNGGMAINVEGKFHSRFETFNPAHGGRGDENHKNTLRQF